LADHDEADPMSVKLRRLRAMQAAGAEVLVVSADVADPDQIRAVLDAAQTRFGSVNGVIHAAGNVTAEGFFGVGQATPELCERQFRTKVHGLLSLEEAVRDQPLDFVVLLSSISSVLAGLGYVAYGAANAYMDAFAHERWRLGDDRWMSIDWDTWDFEFDVEPDPTSLSMRPEEGVDAFRRVLSAGWAPQIIVSTGFLPARIDQWVDLRSLRKGIEITAREAARFHSRPDTGTVHVPPRNSLEQSIVEVWEETLGLRPVGVIDNFFTDLGGNSLLLTQLMARLRSVLEVDISLRSFFDGPTVADLSELIQAERELIDTSGRAWHA
jgi:acyl carrier protein